MSPIDQAINETKKKENEKIDANMHTHTRTHTTNLFNLQSIVRALNNYSFCCCLNSQLSPLPYRRRKKEVIAIIAWCTYMYTFKNAPFRSLVISSTSKWTTTTPTNSMDDVQIIFARFFFFASIFFFNWMFIKPRSSIISKLYSYIAYTLLHRKKNEIEWQKEKNCKFCGLINKTLFPMYINII